MPENIAVVRNNEPLILLQVEAVEQSKLSEIRGKLIARKVILQNDLFVDGKGFSVPMDEESDWLLQSILSDKTVKLKSSESKQAASIKKDLYADQPIAPAATLPSLATDKKAVAPTEDTSKRQIDSPLGKLAIRVGDELSDPVLFDKDHWQKILERNNLLNGILLDNEGPTPSFRNAFSVIGGIPRFVVHDSAFISASVTHTESVHASVVGKFDKIEASASYAFVSASVEASQRQSTGTTTSQAATYAVGRWNLPRVIVQLRPENLCPDPDFVKSARAILDQGEDTPERKYYALHRLFREYGQIWATEVTLGGQLTITDSLTLSSAKTEKELEKSIRAAVGVKLGPFKASTGYGTSVHSAQMDKEFEQFSQNDFAATGGDTRFAQDPGAWVSTVAPVSNWRIIGRRGILPLYMVLGESMRQEIREILETVDHRFLPTILESSRMLKAKEPIRAERDGFLVGRFCCNNAGRSEGWTMVSSDGARERLETAVSFTGFQTANKGVNDKTIILPVRRRDVFDVYTTDEAPRSFPANIVFHEMVDLDEPFFKPVEEVDVLAINQAHGFIKDWKPADSGFLVLTLWENGKPGDVDVLDGQHSTARFSVGIGPVPSVRCHSVCLPILRDHEYRFMAGSDFCSGDARFLPINDRVGGIDNPSFISGCELNRAECDGYLFGYVEISSPDLSHVKELSGFNVKIHTAPDRNKLTEQEPVAAMTMLYNNQGGIHGSLGAPIRKGDYYCLRIEGGSGLQINNFFEFYPLVRR